MGVARRNIVRELLCTGESTLSPQLFVIGVYIMDGPFYLRDSTITPVHPTLHCFPLSLSLSLSISPFLPLPLSLRSRGLREDLHYKYAPTGMHVRQYDVSLFLSLSLSALLLSSFLITLIMSICYMLLVFSSIY